MAEIHFLDARIDLERAGNMHASLSALVERGGDPGPREIQIRSLGRMLAASVKSLRDELAWLGLSEAAVGLDLDRLEQAALLALVYDPEDRSQPVTDLPVRIPQDASSRPRPAPGRPAA